MFDRRMTIKVFVCGVLGVLTDVWVPSVEAASSAVVLMYHRFGESEYPSTNTSSEQLDAHIAELTSGAYNVMTLEDIVVKLKAGETLPDRTVGLSIDDGYLAYLVIESLLECLLNLI